MKKLKVIAGCMMAAGIIPMTAYAEYNLADGEKYMLKKLAMAEAEGEGVTGKALVMMTVMNRIESKEFPDTVETVIFDPGQFEVTEDYGRYWSIEPDSGCDEAYDMISSGWDESEGCLYFRSINCGDWTWHDSSLEYLFQYGNQLFYR